nr:metallophosphoesterase [Ramlibacter albus]
MGVVSDLHAFSNAKGGSDSVLDLSPTALNQTNPLVDLIGSASLVGPVDVLLCAGDICNKADAGGLTQAWAKLQNLKAALSASMIIPTCGNHDLDSRFLGVADDPDPKGALLALQPPFPFADEIMSNKFWARNYAIVVLENGVVVVTLNTSAFHGGLQEEIDHGRVSYRTIEEVEAELASYAAAPAHVLLCHHHPLPLTGWGRKADSEFAKNGQVLFDALIRATGKSWLVIHGHRHVPRLIHGASIVCDSFCARCWQSRSAIKRNREPIPCCPLVSLGFSEPWFNYRNSAELVVERDRRLD